MIEIIDMGGTAADQPPPRRRWTRVAAGLAVLLAMIAGGAVLLHRDSEREAKETARRNAPDAAFTQRLTQLGLAGKVGGSLSGDEAFLAGIPARVAALSQQGSAPQRLSGGARNVRVVWAGDQAGMRVAVVGYEPEAAFHNDLKLAVLTGAPGDRPEAMHFGEVETTAGADQEDVGLPITLQTGTPPDPATGHAGSLLFVVAPNAQDVTVSHALQFTPDGQVETSWRALAKGGEALWAGSLTAAEASIGVLRVDGKDTSLPTEDPAAVFTDLRAPLARVAEPGIDQGRLRRVQDQLMSLRPSDQEVAVFAGSAPLGRDGSVTAGVLRSPENGYLIGWSLDRPAPTSSDPHRQYGAASLATTPVSSFGDLLAAVQLGYSEHGRMAPFAVIAPAGAVSVRSGAVTARVVNRLAVLYLDAPDPSKDPDAEWPPPKQFEALDRQGRVMAVTAAAPAMSLTNG